MLEDFRQDEGLLDRLLMQVYSQPMYEQIDSVYHFANYMYLVGLNIDKLDSILTYCLDHGICSVAMRTNFVTRKMSVRYMMPDCMHFVIRFQMMLFMLIIYSSLVWI